MGLEENGIIKSSESSIEIAATTESNENDQTDAAELHELPAEKYNETLRKIVENKLKVSFGDCKVEISPGSAKGDNYVGLVYRVTVTSPNDDKLNIIAKLPPQCIARREQFVVRPCFVRESLFYDEVYPMYKQFQEEKGIDVAQDGFHEVPEIFASLTDEPFEGLFFEDLKASNFEMFDRLKEVRVDHVNLVMKSLAKMHATGFAIKDQKPEMMKKYSEIKEFFSMHELQTQGIIKWFDNLKKQAFDCLQLSDNEDLKRKAETFFEKNFFELLGIYCTSEAAEPYAIPTHGDCELFKLISKISLINGF